MSQQQAGGGGAIAGAASLLTELAGNAQAVAEQAEKLGRTDEVRGELQAQLSNEVNWASQDRQRQFQQAVVWRRWNIVLGLTAGLLTAAAASTALFSHDAAAIIGLVATFATGALATLNAGQRKIQAQAAACGYQEVEAAATQLIAQLPYLPLETTIQQVDRATARRLQINETAEPPGSRALYRVDRADREVSKYGRPLSSSERNPLALWAKKPQN